MGYSVVIFPGALPNSTPAWTAVTGKPAIEINIGNPGSDANLVSEQAVREGFDRNKVQGFAYEIISPTEIEYTLIDWPIDVACTITKITTQLVGTGTATGNFKIGVTSITGASAIAMTTSQVGTVPTGANVLAQGNSFIFAPTGISVGVTSIRVTVRYTRAN